MNTGRDNWIAGITFFDTRPEGLGSYDVAKGQLTNGDEGRSRGFTLNARWNSGETWIGATFTKPS